MIPPVTGNGMSMAFESAELAIDPIVSFSRGDLTWAQAQQEIASSCDHRFRSRLRWAAWLQRALFLPSARAALLFLAAHSQWVWRGIFERTR
jgi:flavin-dependent dehydrogenase